MAKQIIPCPKCRQPLTFRGWSNRYPRGYERREALAHCPTGCGKYAIRYFKGIPASEPYQVKPPAKKTARGSYKTTPQRKAAIEAIFGSIQEFIDKGILVGMPLQSKT